MIAYTGQTRDRRLLAELTAAGVGTVALTTDLAREWARVPRACWATPALLRDPIRLDERPGLDRLDRMLARDWPRWILDNGAFAAFKGGEAFDLPAWLLGCALADAAVHLGRQAPDFVVLPDMVGGGSESLAFSAQALAVVAADGLHRRLPMALVVQEGTTPDGIPWELPFEVLFVGGASLAWKMGTAASWIRAAHAHGKRCHLGRVGSASRVREAASMGADSIDSALPLWSRPQAARFLAALRAPVQLRLGDA